MSPRWLGRIYFKLGETGKAIMDLKKCWNVPQSPQLPINMAEREQATCKDSRVSIGEGGLLTCQKGGDPRYQVCWSPAETHIDPGVQIILIGELLLLLKLWDFYTLPALNCCYALLNNWFFPSQKWLHFSKRWSDSCVRYFTKCLTGKGLCKERGCEHLTAMLCALQWLPICL